MRDEQTLFRTLSAELEAMVATCFPKTCQNCGRVYENVEAFLTDTQSTGSSSSMLESFGPSETNVVDLNRNCACGSTLMVVFPERRDTTEKGRKMREKFGESLTILVNSGIPEQTARTELIQLMNGRPSRIISKFLNDT